MNVNDGIKIDCTPDKAYVRFDSEGRVWVCANFVFPCGGSLAGWVPNALAKDWMPKVRRLGKRPFYFQPAPVFKCGFRHRHLKDCPWFKAIWEGDEAPAYVVLEEQGLWERLVDKARVKDRLRPCAAVHDLDGKARPSSDAYPVKPHDDSPARLEAQKQEGAAEGAERGKSGGDGCQEAEQVHAS